MDALVDRFGVAELVQHLRISRFLFREARLLDAGDVRRWLDEMIAPDIRYMVPVRLTRERHEMFERDAHEFSSGAFYLNENHATLTTRVLRLEGEYAWAEDPPSRTRHFISNVVVEPDTDDLRNAHWCVTSNVLLFRGKYDSPSHEFLSYQRRDVIGEGDDGRLRLHERTALLDHTTLPLPNLAIFL